MTEYIRLGQPQFDQTSEIKIVTIAEGSDAVRLREKYATTTRDEIERAKLNYHARFYPGIIQTAPQVYSDDESQNRIEVDEFYSVPKIWNHTQGETYSHCWIYPENISSATESPAVSFRTMPLGVDYPGHQIFRAEIVVPSLAVIRPGDQIVNNPAFFFHREVSIGKDKLLLEYDYRSLRDSVLPEAVPEYIRQLSAIGNLTVYTITSD
jgi:hypothetical protein